MQGPSENYDISFSGFFTPFTNIKAITFIILVGLLVYINILFNGFALDDTSQILSNTPAHSIQNISSFFQGSTFGPDVTGSGKIQGVYYKPLLTTFYALLYTMFGANPFSFHLFQLILHMANSIMIFYLFMRFFSRKLAFFLSLLFLIHPINVETVANIASLQDVLFFFFGMVGVTLYIKDAENNLQNSLKTHIIVFFLLLFSLLSKETGILFILILPLFSFLLLKKINKWIVFVPLLSFATYLFLRFFVGHVFFGTAGISPIAEVPLLQRLINIPNIIFYYIKTFFLPIHLLTGQTWVIKIITFSNFYIPLAIDLAVFIIFFILGIYINNRYKAFFKIYLFFLIWFYGGLLLHLQIFPLDSTVADRWFYFPIIGLLGIMGLCVEIFVRRKNYLPFFIFFGCTILILFSLRSFTRNADWYSTFTIISHDITYEGDNAAMQNTLALEYENMNNQSEALKHFQIAYSLDPQDAILSNIGLLYAMQGNFTSAEEIYVKLISINSHFYPAYVNLAHTQLKMNNLRNALTTTQKGLNLFPKSDQLWVFLAFAEYKLGENALAITDLDKAYALSQNSLYLQYKDTISQHQSIDGYF